MAPYRPQHVFDLKPSPIDTRDYKLEGPIDFRDIPEDYDLPSLPPRRDQGQEGSCWGFSGTDAMRQSRAIEGKDDVDHSPAFLYYRTREAMGDTADDTGSDIRTGLDQMLHVGLGIPVTQEFEESRDGYVPPPTAQSNVLGGHAIRCNGWKKDASVPGGFWWKLPNSWGPNAGDHGIYYIPALYLFSPVFGWSEAWSISG
jgi:C1A family cysteine protease